MADLDDDLVGLRVAPRSISTLLAIGLSSIEINLALKFVLVALLAVGASFVAGYVV